VCKEAYELAERQLFIAKERYRSQVNQKQKRDGDNNNVISCNDDNNSNLRQVNDTELPELLETRIRAKNLYETVEARYNTNKRYLENIRVLQKQQQNSNSA